MRTQLKLSIAMACGLLATATANAYVPCTVTLSSMLPGGQMVLQASCPGAEIAGIDWRRNGAEIITGGAALSPTLDNASTTQLIYLTTQALSGQYTAAAAVPADTPPYVFTGAKAMVLNLADPTLTVAVTTGGSVSAASGISACTSSAGTCSATYPAGSTVQLTATPNTGYVLSTWGGDCTGTANVCALNMATLRTVSAAFATSPVAGACGGAKDTPTATQPTDLCANGTTASSVSLANNLYSWTCAGINSSSTASCTAPQIVNGSCGTPPGIPLQSTPTTNLCATGSAGTVTAPSAGNSYNYTWACAGIGTGSTPSGTCTAAAATVNGACGTAKGTTVSSTPNTALCTPTGGSATSVTTNSGTYTWSCNGTGLGATNDTTCYANRAASCGTANGQTVSSTPTGAALCGVGTGTAVLTGSTYNWTCTGSGTANTASCSATYQASAGGCAATPSNYAVQTWAQSDYTNSTTVITQVIPPASGVSFQFTIATASYPKGVKLTDAGSGSKIYSISRCPGGTDGPVLGQNGTMSVNGDGIMDNCADVMGGYVRYDDTSGSTPVFYAGTGLAAQNTCFLPTTTTLGGSTPATYYMNVYNSSATIQASMQFKQLKQTN